MHPYPHQYSATAAGESAGGVAVNATGLPEIRTAPPVEFGGPGGTWSPETLLCASLADCFILTFRAVASASKLEWSHLTCSVDGRLERSEGVMRFTGFATRARLTVPGGSDVASAHALLEKAEQKCLVANSLNAARTLEAEVVQAG